MRKKTEQDYYRLASDRGFKWLGPYSKNVNTNTNWRCPEGHEWAAMYSNITRGRGCPECHLNEVRHKPKDFHDLATSKRLEWAGPFVHNVNEKTWWRCPKDHKWETSYAAIVNGGCPRCAGNLPLSQWSTERIVAIYDGVNVDPVGRLPKSVKGRLMVVCRACGHKWNPIFESLNNYGCPKCAGLLPLYKRSESEIMKIYNDAGVDLLGKLPRHHTDKPKVRCRICGHKWNPSYNALQNGSGCPRCKASKGETRIAHILSSMGIDFETEKRFPTCRNKKPLPFDFFIPVANLLIEYQGEQHFTTVWNPLSYIKRNDKIKADWVDQSPYELLYINYWQYDHIVEILADRSL